MADKQAGVSGRDALLLLRHTHTGRYCSNNCAFCEEHQVCFTHGVESDYIQQRYCNYWRKNKLNNIKHECEVLRADLKMCPPVILWSETYSIVHISIHKKNYSTVRICDCRLKEQLLTRVAAQSWSMVVGAVVKIQRVPVVFCCKTYNLNLENFKKKQG